MNDLLVGIVGTVAFLSINYLVRKVIHFYKNRIIKGPMVCCDGPECIHIFGCLQRNGSVRVCKLDCGREQFFACTHETDLINLGESKREVVLATDACDLCQDDHEIRECDAEEFLPIAFNSDELGEEGLSELLAA